MEDHHEGEPLPRSFYARPAVALAPDLLNKVIACGPVAGRIVEVEAYAGADDPASHAYRGRTLRNDVMFGPPGHLYVYFTYGMHYCVNIVAASEGQASAVLLRALAPLCGTEVMAERRGTTSASPLVLTSGPAKLAQALGIDRRYNGADLAAAQPAITLFSDGVEPPGRPSQGPRIGIRAAVEFPWRWWVPGDPNVSRPRAARVDPALPSN